MTNLIIERDLVTHEILEAHHENLIVIHARHLPPLARCELGHDAIHKPSRLLVLDGHRHLAVHEGFEPGLIRLNLVRKLITLLGELKHSLNSLHCTVYTCDFFICRVQQG